MVILDGMRQECSQAWTSELSAVRQGIFGHAETMWARPRVQQRTVAAVRGKATGAELKGAGLLQSCRQLFGGAIQVRVDSHGLSLFDVGFDVIRVEAGLRGRLSQSQSSLKDAGIRFHGADIKGCHSFIHQMQNGKSLLDETQVRDAGIRQQYEFFSGRFELVQHREDAVIEPENIGYRMTQLIDIESVTAEVGEFLLKLFLGQFAPFHGPLSTFVHQKGFDIFRGQAAEFCDVSDHSIMGEMHQNVAHIKKTGLDRHGDLRHWEQREQE